MSTIFFCGDVHGDFQHVIEEVQAHRPEAIVLMGDLQARGPLEVELCAILVHTEVWFIHGNHDTDSESDHDHLFGSALAERNLHGRVATVAGVRIAGLGGIFREQVGARQNRETTPPRRISSRAAARATAGAAACH
jgi:predicted phosphodiesterase